MLMRVRRLWFLFRIWREIKYDVFLIYRDSAVGATLYHDLREIKINTYRKTDTELWDAPEVLGKLNRAIELSQFIIIVFNEAFAASSTCLDLLVYITDNFGKRHYSKIIPVFDGVDRSDLEHQTGNYEEAFRKHERDNMEKVDEWRDALKEVSILPSWKLVDQDLYTFTVLQQIRDAVSKKVGRAVLNRGYFRGIRNGFTTTTAYISPPYECSERNRNRNLAPCRIPLLNEDYMVGLDSRLKEVLSHMRFELDRVLFVGIPGDVGIGKTTLAREIYNMIADHFDASCFIPHVKENSRKHLLVRLQDKLLSDLIGVIREKILNVTQGNVAIFNYLYKKKVLLILDDVDEVDQLNALAKQPNFFGPGSIVIITTKNENVLSKYDNVTKHNVPSLNYTNALDLLRHHAWKNKYIFPEDIDIFNQFVDCTSGNPMNLKEIGIELRGRPMELWPDVLQEIQRVGVAQWVANIIWLREAVESRQSQQGFETSVLKILQTVQKICTYNPNWKLFGFLSSLVWLPCYALNPSVIHLIGGWDDWKIFLYVMLSLYVMYNMLLATQAILKAIYLRYKVVSFLALFFIAIYTYYFALACVSLSLSGRMRDERELGLFTFSLHMVLTRRIS